MDACSSQASGSALDVSEGDRVVFSAYAGMTVKVDGDELLVMSENEILAILK